MKTAVLWALIALNAALLLSLLSQFTRDNTARAQVGAARRPGDYLMINGNIVSGSAGVVYVVDTVNGQLGAMYFNDSGPGSRIESMPPIDLAGVFQQPLPGGSTPSKGKKPY